LRHHPGRRAAQGYTRCRNAIWAADPNNEAEIAYITGHSLRDVRSILDANYLHRDPALGESAIRKLERERRD